MARKVTAPDELQRETSTLFRPSLDSDSSVAIICGAAIEKALMSLLRNTLLAKSETVDKMFSESGILGSSHKCATMAYALGLISTTLFQNITFIEGIRNVFAHSNTTLTG